MRERKSLETLNQMKQIVDLEHWIKNVTKNGLEKPKEIKSLLLNLFLSLMWFKSISILFLQYATWQNLML